MSTNKPTDQILNKVLADNDRMRESHAENYDERSTSDFTEENSLSLESQAERSQSTILSLAKKPARTLSKSMESIESSSAVLQSAVDSGLDPSLSSKYQVGLDLTAGLPASQSITERKSVASQSAKTNARNSKSVKFIAAQLNAPGSLYINVNEENRFSMIPTKNRVPKFTPNPKPSPFKCNCIRFPTSKSFADEHTCCPKHCQNRHQRPRPKNTYSRDKSSDRSSSRSSNSLDKDEYRRYGNSHSFIAYPSSGRCRLHDSHSLKASRRLKPEPTSIGQIFTTHNSRNNASYNNSAKQLLIQIPPTGDQEEDVTNDSDDMPESSLSRTRSLRNSVFGSRKRFLKSSLRGLKDTGVKEFQGNKRDYFVELKEVLGKFSEWNSSSPDSGVQPPDKDQEFSSLARPLLDWISKNYEYQQEDSDHESTTQQSSKAAQQKNTKDDLEAASTSLSSSKPPMQFNSGSNEEIEIIDPAEIELYSGVRSLQSLSSLSSPSCPSFSSQTASQHAHFETSSGRDDASTIAQNTIKSLNDEFNASMQSRLLSDQELAALKCEFYEKKLIDLTSELEEIKAKNKNKQSKKFKIVLRSEYEALKLQLQAFRDDYKTEHAEKTYYLGLCDQYTKKIEELEDLLNQQQIEKQFRASTLNPFVTKPSKPSPKKKLNSSSDAPMDLKSFTSIGADLF